KRQQERRVLQSAAGVPQKAQADHAGGVQQPDQAAAPGGGGALGGQQAHGEITQSQRQHRPGGGRKVDVQGADEPGYGGGQQHGEQRQDPGVLQQLRLRIVPFGQRQGLGCVVLAFRHGSLRSAALQVIFLQQR